MIVEGRIYVYREKSIIRMMHRLRAKNRYVWGVLIGPAIATTLLLFTISFCLERLGDLGFWLRSLIGYQP